MSHESFLYYDNNYLNFSNESGFDDLFGLFHGSRKRIRCSADSLCLQLGSEMSWSDEIRTRSRGLSS